MPPKAAALSRIPVTPLPSGTPAAPAPSSSMVTVSSPLPVPRRAGGLHDEDDGGLPGAGVPHHVRQRLLDNPVGGLLDSIGQLRGGGPDPAGSG